MSFDLTNLENYVNQTKLPILKKMVLGSRSLDFMTIQAGVKNTENINILSSDLVAQAGGSCGFNADGTVTLTTQPITVDQITVNEEYCLDNLNDFWTQTIMNAGSYQEDMPTPVEEVFVQDKIDKLNALTEDLIWKGSPLASGNLNKSTGFIYLTDRTYSASTINGNTGNFTAITAANIVAIIDNMVAAIPTDIIDQPDLNLLMGYEHYRLMAKALRDLNLFHYTGAENQGQEFSQIWPGTNLKISAVRGLNQTNRMFLTTKSNAFYGTDLLSDKEQFDLWFSKDNQTLRFISKFKQGVGFGFPEFVVHYKNR